MGIEIGLCPYRPDKIRKGGQEDDKANTADR